MKLPLPRRAVRPSARASVPAGRAPDRPPSAGHALARRADRAMRGLVHGLQLVVDGGLAAIGDSPRELVHEDGKLQVWRYRPPGPDEFELGHETYVLEPRTLPVPVLLVPPLMVRPTIYDLRAEHSLVRAFRRAGLDVYLVDFGVPDKDDEAVRLDDYVLDFLPAAVAAVRASSGQADLSLVGYCMGAVFSLLYRAAAADAGVRNLVTIAAPIDWSKMGLVSRLARTAGRPARAIVDRVGNIPGVVNSEALKMLRPVKRFTRYKDLLANLWDEEYVRAFDTMNRWTNDFIPYPRDAFKQLVSDFFLENGLVTGMRLRDRVADLRTIDCPLLAFAGREDTIATPASARAIRDLTSSRDFEYHEVPGGHLAVMAGGGAPRHVWEPAARWLRPRSV